MNCHEINKLITRDEKKQLREHFKITRQWLNRILKGEGAKWGDADKVLERAEKMITARQKMTKDLNENQEDK